MIAQRRLPRSPARVLQVVGVEVDGRVLLRRGRKSVVSSVHRRPVTAKVGAFTRRASRRSHDRSANDGSSSLPS